MAYTNINFKTKKALKDAVAAHAAGKGPAVTVPTDLGGKVINGSVFLEGPHYPAPHAWYAQATMKDGKVVSVK